jgi:CspA family cold shock protein
MPFGIVKWYREGQGRGIIIPDDGSRELTVEHFEVAGEGFKVLSEGQRVKYDVGETGKGKVARNVGSID